jgi:hypothetical protein
MVHLGCDFCREKVALHVFPSLSWPPSWLLSSNFRQQKRIFHMREGLVFRTIFGKGKGAIAFPLAPGRY